MLTDVVACSEPFCNSVDTFLCVKHCKRYVCFEHLKEHHRIYEQGKTDVPTELSRRIQQRFSLYKKLIDPIKLNEQEKRDIEIACTEIRKTYEQRRHDHYQLEKEEQLILQSQSTVEDLKAYLEKLNTAIEREQQRERIYSNGDAPVHVKIEPSESVDAEHFESSDQSANMYSSHMIHNPSSNSTNVSTDNRNNNIYTADEGERSDSNFSELDITDSDYEDPPHRKISNNNSLSASNLNQSVTIYRGVCPIVGPGTFGILPIHNIRFCEGKHSCLYNHLQSFHHMTARSAYKLCKAVLKQRDPAVTILFSPDEVLFNKNFHVACPFNQDSKNPFECQPRYIQKAPCLSIISRLDMPRHLRDVHHVTRTCALKIVAEMRRCSRNSEKSQEVNLNRYLFDKHENIIQSIDEKTSTRTSKQNKKQK